MELIGGTEGVDGLIKWALWDVPMLHGRWEGKSSVHEIFRNTVIERVSLH
jgi:hypothetical protein